MNNQKGFSLVELMVAVMVSSFISYGIYMAMIIGSAQTQSTDIKMSIQDSAREGLYKMIQEIRQSSPDRITIGPGGTTLQFSVPDPVNSVILPGGANPNNLPVYSTNWPAAHTIQYQLGGLNNRQLIRTDLTVGQVTVMANDVVGINFIGNSAAPTVVTVNLGVQRRLTNNRLIPGTPLQVQAQAEIRNA